MNQFPNEQRNKISGNILIGAFVIFIGVLLLVNNTFLELPFWVFKWYTLLIVIGLFVGYKNNWKDNTWIVLVAIGGFFTAKRFIPGFDFWSIAFPLLLLGIGLYMILRPKNLGFGKRKKFKAFNQDSNAPFNQDPNVPNNLDPNAPINQDSNAGFNQDPNASFNQDPNTGFNQGFSTENGDSKSSAYNDYTGMNDYIESVNVFGGSQQVVYSKNFKGGEIVAVFGGCDVNFSQADFEGVVKLEVVAVFGGAKIIVPSGWEVKSVVTAIMGGVTDRRPIHPISENNRKLLIIEGVAMFGGVEIRSF